MSELLPALAGKRGQLHLSMQIHCGHAPRDVVHLPPEAR